MERLTNVCFCALLLVMVVVLSTVQANLRIVSIEMEAKFEENHSAGFVDRKKGM